MTVTIYHNPRCSKSRQTLALLEAKGIAPVIVEYLKEPPSAAELKRILESLGLRPRDVLRKSEPRYAELGLKERELTDLSFAAARARVDHIGAGAASHHFQQAHDEPHREDDDGAEQEVAERLLDCGEAHVVDAGDEPLQAVDDVEGAEAERRQDDAHDQR